MRRSIAAFAMMLTPLAAATAQSSQPAYYGHEWMWWGPWFMLMPLLFLALIIAGVVFRVRHLWPSAHLTDRRRAMDVLDERYARGEIERDEYLKRRSDIAGA